MLRGARKALLIATALILLTLSITTYLINTYLTYTPLSKRLPTLNGYLLTYDGPELTKELWSNGEVLKIREVVTVLEMPIYFITSSRNSTQYDLSKDYPIPPHSYYVAIAELLYWRFIASYALSLAIEPSQSPNATLPYLYRYVVPKLVRKVVLTKVRGSEELPNFSYITYTPYLLRLEGRGPCIAQSMASSLFASITLDAVVANAVIEVPNGSHIISLLVLPSTIFKSRG